MRRTKRPLLVDIERYYGLSVYGDLVIHPSSWDRPTMDFNPPPTFMQSKVLEKNNNGKYVLSIHPVDSTRNEFPLYSYTFW